MPSALAMVVALVGLNLGASMANPRWRTLPPTPSPIAGETRGFAKVNGAKLYYATLGSGSPVVLLHGGLANSDYWGYQVRALASGHKVILIDSRGHGRSTRDRQSYSYDLMADDVLGVMDRLNVAKVDVVGWSDGAILGLDIAMHHPNRVRRIFAFAANTDTSGVKEGAERDPTFMNYIERVGQEYQHLSATPKDFDGFAGQIGQMWKDQPNWTAASLHKIGVPVLIVDGDHDEVIKREHTEFIANSIPGAGLLILPNTSHFAFLQDPTLFNAAMLDFLDEN